MPNTMIRRSQRLVQKASLFNETKPNCISNQKVIKKRIKATILSSEGPSKTSSVETVKRIAEEVIILSQKTHLDDAVSHIKSKDPKLGRYLDDDMIIKLKRRFKEKVEDINVFKTLLSSIIYQQIHGKAAEAILGRFLKLFNNNFPTPEQLLQTSIEDLRSVGLSARKTEYIRDLACKMMDGTITPEKFESMPAQEISRQLCSVKGIGQWTVDMFLMHDLHHSDILPLGDLAVRKGIARHFGLKMSNEKSFKNKIPPELEESSDIWRPYRTIGSILMWNIADTKTLAD